MSDADVEKAICESIANVETENTYHIAEEIKEMKNSIIEKESSNKFLKKLVDLHDKKRKEESSEYKL